MKKDYIMICPQCGSTDILPHKKGRHEIHSGEVFEATWFPHRCAGCGYSGLLFPEVPVKHLDAARKEIKAWSKHRK